MRGWCVWNRVKGFGCWIYGLCLSGSYRLLRSCFDSLPFCCLVSRLVVSLGCFRLFYLCGLIRLGSCRLVRCGCTRRRCQVWIFWGVILGQERGLLQNYWRFLLIVYIWCILWIPNRPFVCWFLQRYLWSFYRWLIGILKLFVNHIILCVWCGSR